MCASEKIQWRTSGASGAKILRHCKNPPYTSYRGGQWRKRHCALLRQWRTSAAPSLPYTKLSRADCRQPIAAVQNIFDWRDGRE